MTGMETASSMYRAVSRFSVMVSRFTSGIARWAAETAKEDDHTSGKPAASMRRGGERVVGADHRDEARAAEE